MSSAPAAHAPSRHPARDLVGWFLRIFAGALGVSLALAALVLLLAAPARASEFAAAAAITPARAEGMKPADAGRGTLILRGEGTSQPAVLLHTDVSVRITGPIARARVVQRFTNPGDRWREGIYVFPLPDNAAVDRLRLVVGERVVEGEIREREAARKEYEAARAAGQRSALVEQERPNLFTTNVANIGPGQTVVVEIEYQQTLAYERRDGMGRYRLRFPLVAGPRYIPGEPTGPAGHGWARNTDQVPDASRITPPVRHPRAGAINPVSLRIELDAGMTVHEVDSAYHMVRVDAPTASRRVVELAGGDVPADRDFELSWTVAGGNGPQVSLFTEQGDAGAHALLMLVPPMLAGRTQALPREVTFVIDTSGSMEGTSIVQAREALALAVARLAPGDRFNLIEFNDRPTPLFPSAQAADEANVAKALAWVRRLRAQGGTEMAAALDLALDGRSDGARVRQVIFLTDGMVGNEGALFELIKGRLGDARLFTVGIGSAPNAHFMRKAAEAGRGSYTYIGKVEEVRARMSELFARLESPVLKNVTVAWQGAGAVDASPAQLPDLYLGEPVLVSAALERPVGNVVVSGTRDGVRWESVLDLAEASRGRGLGVLWARRRIEALMDSLHDGADAETVRRDVVALALDHHLVSRYTSLVAVDRSPARPADKPLESSAVPVNLPAGMDHAAVFGELPAGATDARWNLLVGSFALVCAALLWGASRARIPFRPEA